MEKNQFNKAEKDQSIKHKLGDAIERVGEKLSDMGASKLGQKVYNSGNKIEHDEQADTKPFNKPTI